MTFTTSPPIYQIEKPDSLPIALLRTRVTIQKVFWIGVTFYDLQRRQKETLIAVLQKIL